MSSRQADRSTEQQAQTYYLGPPTSFSHAAALEGLPTSTPLPLPSFTALFNTLQSLPAHHTPPTYAVLPIENSTNGAVVQALDLLAQCGLQPQSPYSNIQALDEHYLSVHHCLFVHKSALSPDFLGLDNPLTDTTPIQPLLEALQIKTLYTHPQVWGQCTNFLNTYLPPGHVAKVDVSSTSAAASHVSQHGSTTNRIAAISSLLAGTANPDLVLVAKNIENDPGTNTTRFLVLANRVQEGVQGELSRLMSESAPRAPLKCLLVFTIENSRPGSLAEALSVFRDVGANLSNIQSRPGGLKTWEYVLFVECLFEGESAEGGEDGRVQTLVSKLEGVAERVRLLGKWRDRLTR